MRKPGKALVSVIIPTYNEEVNISRLIKSIRGQSYKKVETIVVDDGSSDSTVSIAKKLGAVVYPRKHAERSVQRNFGASKARGVHLLFLDADMELSRNVLKECVDAMKNEVKIGAVVIPEKSIATNFWEKVKSFERSFYNLEGDEHTDAARFFRKSAFIKAGGYDETITGPEDWDLPETVKKLGYRIVRTKSVIFHYEKVSSLFKLAKKKYYYALKSHRYLSKQKISLVNPKTIYFLRPVFYRNWKVLASNPLMSVAMIVMLSVEMVGGGIGYIVGRLRRL